MSTQQSPQRPARPTGGGGGGGGAMPTTTTTTTTTGSNTHGGGSAGATFLRKLQAPGNSHQLVGILTLVVSGGILLVMTGMTLTATVLGMIFFAPLIVITAPIWVPVGVVVFLVVAGVLSMCGMVVGALAVGSWVYKYVRGWRPPGSDRVDYARSRIADTASHVKDYAREYGGYLQSRVKDAAPSA